MPHSTPADSTLERRVRALEENHGFAERLLEELGEEVRALGRRVTELTQRMIRLEASMAKRAADAPPETEGEDAPN